MTDDFILKWDEQNQQLFGEDPDTGDKIPVPIESLSTEDSHSENQHRIGDDVVLSETADGRLEVLVTDE